LLLGWSKAGPALMEESCNAEAPAIPFGWDHWEPRWLDASGAAHRYDLQGPSLIFGS
jgi:hypothetical protein